MRSYAQGSLEYLLMVGASILVVAVVIVSVFGVVVDTNDQNSATDYNTQMQKLNDLKKDDSTQKQDSVPSITLFSINNLSAVPKGNSINLTLPSGTDIYALTPEILYKGESISPALGSTLDFSNPVEYTITDENGKSKKYTVTITLESIESDLDKNLIYYGFGYTPLETKLSSEGSNKIISLTFSYGTPTVMYIELLIPQTTVFSTAIITGEGIEGPNEEISEWDDGNMVKYVYLTRDFSNPIEFTVTATDGSKQKYIIRSTFLLNSANFIQTFITSSPALIGAIDNDKNTITLVMPNGVGTTLLAPRVILSKGAVSSPASGTTQNFSNPVQYTITAQNGDTRKYTVNVIEETKEYSKISSCSQLQDMTLTGNYVLENNIDCSSISNFVPIGTRDNPFTGEFDGNGKVIMNLSINSSDYFTGLFGAVSGNIRNVGIVNATISGWSMVGLLAGEQKSGTIFNSYATGRINSSMQFVGGLVGDQYSNGVISNCYADANVTSSSSIGGLVGLQNGLVTESYSKGIVIGNEYTGGLTSYSYTAGTVIDSYWDTQTSLQTGGGGGEGKTTQEMKQPSTFSSWSNAIWQFEEDNYPKLMWEKFGDLNSYEYGTISNPWPISNCTELQNIQNNLGSNYRLTQDINCAEVESFSQIAGGYENGGGLESTFSGMLDGQNHTISNVNTGSGLFGGISGTVKNLGIINSKATALNTAGLLAGYVFGTISNCYSTGTVKGGTSVGGLVGNLQGIVTDSYSTATVVGTGVATGGLVGYVYTSSAVVSNSYSTGAVSGGNQTGGLVGTLIGKIQNSYSTSNVTGNDSVGGLVGIQSNGTTIINSFSIGRVKGNSTIGGLVGKQVASGVKTVTDSYWDINTSNLSESVAGIGKTTQEMKSASTFSSWDTLLWSIEEGKYPSLKKFNNTVVFTEPVEPLTFSWSTTYDAKNFYDANEYCLSLGGRLPTFGELCNALLYQNSSFSADIYAYWTIDQMAAVNATNRNCIGNAPDAYKNNAYPFKCVAK